MGEGQTAKVFLVFSVFHHCFMQCSCAVSAIYIYNNIYIYILFFYMQVAIHSIIFIPFRGKDWYSLPEEAAEAWSTKKSKNIHVCTQYV